MKKITAFIFILSSVNCSAQFSWQNVGSGVGTNVNHSCLTLLDDTINNVLYAGGVFIDVDTFECSGIAFWNGNIWQTNAPSPTGAGLPHISSLVLYNGTIYGSAYSTSAGVGGVFHYDGTTWVSDGTANDYVYTLRVYHNKLYVGGEFTTVNGIPAKRIACYDGTSWSAVGGGVQWTQACCSDVRAMHVWNDKLYVGGTFDKAGTLDNVNSIAVWNDTSWSNLGTGVLNYGTGLSTAYVYAIDDYKNELYVGGDLNDAGGVPVSGICRWNDTAWSDVGGGFDVPPHVYCMLNKDSSLYVGGLFGGASGVSGTGDLARWDGNLFHSVGGGLTSGSIRCIAEYNDELYIGGTFSQVGGTFTRNIAKYGIYNGVENLNEDQSEIIVYPNPVSEKITLELKSRYNNCTFEISNLLGEKILSQQIEKNKTEIDVSQLPQGVYFLRAQMNDGSMQVSKFVKQ